MTGKMFDIAREAMPERRLSGALLNEAMGGLSTREMASRLNVSQRTIQRWLVEGLTFDQADSAAVSLGKHPIEIWSDWAKDDDD